MYTMLKLLFLTLFLVLIENGAANLDFHRLRDEIFKRGGNISTALKMFDASAKFLPDGILGGNFHNFGSYDECLSIKDYQIQGKYCYGTLSPLKLLSMLSKEQIEVLMLVHEFAEKEQNSTEIGEAASSKIANLLGFHFGVCVPNTTEPKGIFPLVDFDENYCYSEDPKLETKHWIALVVIGVLVLCAVLSTIYDVVSSYKGNKPHIALTAFSLYSNGKKLFKAAKNDNQLQCLHGLKTLNMMWVILGHTYVHMALSGSVDNLFSLSQWMDDPKSMSIIAGTISVDSFFAIGGLLTTYSFLKGPDKNLKERLKDVPIMYIHRYLRLTPALAIMVLIYATGLIKFLGDGPRWGLMQPLAVEPCEQKWYSTLLYYQNYMTTASEQLMCIDQSWYLSVDMQLFLLSPLILIPLKTFPKHVLALKVILIGIGIGVPFFIGYSNNFNGLMLGSTTSTYIEDYYFKTHTRFSPYIIGMLAGYFIYKMNSGERKLKLNIIQSSILWLITIGIMLTCVFDGSKLVKDTSNAVVDGLYLGFNRSIWSCALSFLIILCVSGNGGPINAFLSHHIMQLLSRLSYAMYLTHYLIILVGNLSRRSSMHFTDGNAIFMFFGNFIITAVVSMVFSLLFESPFMILERWIFSGGKKSS